MKSSDCAIKSLLNRTLNMFVCFDYLFILWRKGSPQILTVSIPFIVVLFITPSAIRQASGLRLTPANRGVRSPEIPMAQKPGGSQPKGDLIRVDCGNLGFFAFIFFCVLFYTNGGSVGRRLTQRHTPEDKVTKKRTKRATNGRTSKKKLKQKMERANKDTNKGTGEQTKNKVTKVDGEKIIGGIEGTGIERGASGKSFQIC